MVDQTGTGIGTGTGTLGLISRQRRTGTARLKGLRSLVNIIQQIFSNLD